MALDRQMIINVLQLAIAFLLTSSGFFEQEIPLAAIREAEKTLESMKQQRISEERASAGTPRIGFPRGFPRDAELGVAFVEYRISYKHTYEFWASPIPDTNYTFMDAYTFLVESGGSCIGAIEVSKFKDAEGHKAFVRKVLEKRPPDPNFDIKAEMSLLEPEYSAVGGQYMPHWRNHKCHARAILSCYPETKGYSLVYLRSESVFGFLIQGPDEVIYFVMGSSCKLKAYESLRQQQLERIERKYNKPEKADSF